MRVVSAHSLGFVSDQLHDDCFRDTGILQQRDRRVPLRMTAQTVGRAFGVPAFAFASMRRFIAKPGLCQQIGKLVRESSRAFLPCYRSRRLWVDIPLTTGWAAFNVSFERRCDWNRESFSGFAGPDPDFVSSQVDIVPV